MKSTVKIIWSFQISPLLQNHSLAVIVQATRVINSKASATKTAMEENRHIWQTWNTAGNKREWEYELKDRLVLRRDSHFAFSIFKHLPLPHKMILSPSPEHQSAQKTGKQGHNHPTSLHAWHTELHTPSTTPGVLFPFCVQRVVHLSLSLLQRCCSTSRESSPKNVFQ